MQRLNANVSFRSLVMDPAAIAALGQDDVRLLRLKLPVTLNFRPDGAINNVFFGTPSFDVPGFDDDNDDNVEASVNSDDDDGESSEMDTFPANDSDNDANGSEVEIDDDGDIGDEGKSSEMDTDPANDNDNDANVSEVEIDDDGDDHGYDSDDSVKILFEVINLD